MSAPRCPECRSGKCRNCDGLTLNDSDQFVGCPCTCQQPASTADLDARDHHQIPGPEASR